MTPVQLQGGHQIALLRGGDALFPAMLEAIAGAEHDIWLASYLVNDDAASQALVQALARAARRGVRVRLVLDGFGARHALPWWHEQLGDSGAALAVFRPLNRWWHWLRPGQLRRLHQKLCVVDGGTGFVGGINVIDDRIDLTHGSLAAPRLDFAVRMQGPAVAELEMQLRRLWARSWMGRDHGEEWRAWWQRIKGLAERLRGAGAQRAALRLRQADRRPVRLAYVQRDNLRNRHAIERAYLQGLRSARHRFELICPYFYPSRRLLRALLGAARRGVRVRLLLQGQADYRLARWAGQALYERLLARGVQVFEYRAAFLHAKVALADGEWATVGSSNLDPTSLLLNLEANVVVVDADFNAALAAEFETALQGAEAVQPQQAPVGLRAWALRLMVGWVAQVYLRLAGGGEGY
jgi:cardiolipin synthase A/B